MVPSQKSATPTSTPWSASRASRPDLSASGGSNSRDADDHDLPHGVSFTVAYDLWRRGWDAALSAIATATQSRALSATDAAMHRAAIAVEREHVTRHFAHLLRTERLPAA